MLRLREDNQTLSLSRGHMMDNAVGENEGVQAAVVESKLGRAVTLRRLSPFRDSICPKD